MSPVRACRLPSQSVRGYLQRTAGGAALPLPYDPSHARHWVPAAGTYEFEVVECKLAQFKTGAQGLRMQLAVSVPHGAPLKLSTNIVFGERSTWKMLELCQCLRVRFDPPCDAEDLVGKRGRAEFRVEEDVRDGLRTLAPTKYLEAPAKAGA